MKEGAERRAMRCAVSGWVGVRGARCSGGMIQRFVVRRALHGEPAGDRSGPLPVGRRWAPVSEKSHTNSRDWRCVWETPADGWALPFDRGNVAWKMAIYVARIIEEAYVFDEKASRLKVVGCRWVGRVGWVGWVGWGERLSGRGDGQPESRPVWGTRSSDPCPLLRTMRG